MPVYTELSRLHRCVTIVARGAIAPEEIGGAFGQLAAEKVPHFAKLVDVASATSEVTPEQVERIATALASRGAESGRGPIAFLVAQGHDTFPRLFAATQDQRRVHLFTSIHQARDWLMRTLHAGWQGAVEGETTPWTDPAREAMLFRRGQRRTVPVRRFSRPSYAQA